MGSPCLFTRQRGVKIVYFYWFYLERKASFIDINNIASFKLFLIAWLREYRTFSDSSVISLKSSPWFQLGTIFRKKIVFHYQTFFLLHISSLSECS